MHNIIIDKPYHFVPPCDSWFWPRALSLYMSRYLDRSHGMVRVECVGSERLKSSIQAGHGVLLAPNHSRPCDPMILSVLARTCGRDFYLMASWHLFMQNRVLTWLLRRAGAFSIYREGMDKSALNAAIDILVEARRPLVVFPEGIVSRTNDIVNPLMEGLSFIARNAAKKRVKNAPQAKVVVHPIAINYFFHGDIHASAHPVLDEIETRLTWRRKPGGTLVERIYRVGDALLGLKEMEFTGSTQRGEIVPRMQNLIDHLLVPLETEYRAGQRETNTIARVKRLRQSILPDMAAGEISDMERERRWRQLADVYLAQQLDFYRPDYVRSRPTPERILETVERFEEDLTDQARIHRPMSAVVQVGEALEVNPERERGAADPVLHHVEESLKSMLSKTSSERTAPIKEA